MFSQPLQKLDIILKGFEIENLEFIGLNTTLTLAVQKFIMQTKIINHKIPLNYPKNIQKPLKEA